jgi:large subunit ribosomal protein L23
MAVIEEKKENKVVAKKAEKKVAKKEKIVAANHADVIQRVLIEPWITEKSHAAIAENKYSFKVSRTSTKSEVKVAIENYYKVKVAGVSVVNVKEKTKAYGRYPAKKAGFKKAIVTLKKGDKIELFQAA